MRKKIPVLISDSISTGRLAQRGRIFKSKDESDLPDSEIAEKLDTPRLKFVRLMLFLITAVFLVRLFVLTIVEGGKYRNWAQNNSIRLVEVEAKRGRILDRNGKVLAHSTQEYFLSKGDNKQKISYEQARELEREGLAGENFDGELGRISREVIRVYPFGEVTAHVLGYTSGVQETDVAKNPKLAPFEFVGRLGIEETYDEVLRGVNGRKIVEVDASGRTISILGETAARDGQDVHLAIDSELSKTAFEVMRAALTKAKSDAGALVITKPENGEVLALLSLPSFDPTDVGRFVTREEKPLFNRVIAGSYTPGSVFKIVSSVAGLASGAVTGDTEIEDVGEFELGGVKFPNWFYKVYGGRDGVLRLDRAIARSNDIFFYRLGERTGLSQMRKWALLLGFGQKTGIDLPGEAFGLVGDEAWKLANLGDSWFLGDTMHLAIGQGFVVTTPLQVNLMTAIVANGGRRVIPHIVSSVQSGNGEQIVVGESREEDIGLASEHLEIVRSGMRQACQEKGTAWPFFKSTYTISCKTGTAEKAQGNPHAWFTAYAPSTLPEHSITVIIENGGEGSSVAAPVAKEILDWWFESK